MDRVNIKKYHYKFNDLNIPTSCVERIIGYEPGQAPTPFGSIIKEVFQEAAKHCDIRAGILYTDDVLIDHKKNTLHSEGKTFTLDANIVKMLANTESFFLMQCTAGKGIEQWAKDEAETDPFKSYIIDTLGSEIVDFAADKVQEEIKKQAKEKGMLISDRVCPGYCGWTVHDQHVLFSFFPDNYCGIQLTESALMNPIKSISGLIGVGKNVKQLGKNTCSVCTMTDCIYRFKRHQRHK